MKIEKMKTVAMILVALPVILFLVSNVIAADTTPYSYYGANAQIFFPTISEDQCASGEGQDFIVQIAPGSCEPTVVRSDLLAEQNVPVFCRLIGFKINPLIEVPTIKSIKLMGQAAKTITGTAVYHPYRAQYGGVTQTVSSPLWDNLGYIVVSLKNQPVESKIPEFIEENLTARIEYNMENSFGVSLNQRNLKEMSDSQWKASYSDFSFWQGKGYVRASEIKADSAKISVYSNPSASPISSYVLKKGIGESNIIYLPGYYCSGGVIVKLDDVRYPQTTAQLNVDGDIVDVAVGDKFAADMCEMKSIEPDRFGVTGKVTINCQGNIYSFSKQSISAQLEITNGGTTMPAQWKSTGQVVYENITTQEIYYLISAGRQRIVQVLSTKTKKYETVDFAIIAKFSKGWFPNSTAIVNATNDLRRYFQSSSFSADNFDKNSLIADLASKIKVQGADKVYVFGPENLKLENGQISISLKDVNGMINKGWSKEVEDEYSKSINAYKEVVFNWPGAKSPQGYNYGETALYEAAMKAKSLGKIVDEYDLLNMWKENYGSNETAKKMLADIATSDSSAASQTIKAFDKTFYVELSSIDQPSQDDLSVSLSINNRASVVYHLEEPLSDPLSSWRIKNILETGIVIENITNPDQTLTLGMSSPVTSGKVQIPVKVTAININKVARVRVIPYSKSGVTEANFTFRAYVEKRAIKLSPEQTKDVIKALNSSIDSLSKVVEGMGNVLKVWKGICTATSAVLWASNFIENLFGGTQTVARKLIMRGDPQNGITGWTQKCQGMVGFQKEFKTFSECYSANEAKIKAEVNIMAKALNTSTSLFDNAKNAVTKKEGRPFLGIFPTYIEDTDKIFENLQNGLVASNLIPTNPITYIDRSGLPKVIPVKDLEILKTIQTLEQKNQIFESDARVLLNNLAVVKQCNPFPEKSDVERLCNEAKNLVADRISSLNSIVQRDSAQKAAEDALKQKGLNIKVTYIPLGDIGKIPNVTIMSFDTVSLLKADDFYIKGLNSTERAYLDEYTKSPGFRVPIKMAAIGSEGGQLYLVFLNNIPATTNIDAGVYIYDIDYALELSAAGTAGKEQINSEAISKKQSSCNISLLSAKIRTSSPDLSNLIFINESGVDKTEQIMKAFSDEYTKVSGQINYTLQTGLSEFKDDATIYNSILQYQGTYDNIANFEGTAPYGSLRYLTTKFIKYFCYQAWNYAREKDVRYIGCTGDNPQISVVLSGLLNCPGMIRDDILAYLKKQTPPSNTIPQNIQDCITSNLAWENQNCVITPSDIASFRATTTGFKVAKNVTLKKPGSPDVIITQVKVPISTLRCDYNTYNGTKEVTFWDANPYKGLVAMMPVDMGDGWYAATKAYNSGMEAFMESGKLKAFYLCNVGANGNSDFDPGLGAKGDDSCTLITLSTWNSLKISLCNRDQTKSAELINKAIGCIETAQGKYQSGLRAGEKISTKCGDFVMGKPPAAVPDLQCEDFMDPTMCAIMFNVCDPVICPPSRCNLGGAYTVDNVIQTGVIGGIVLCLPNGFGISGGKVLVPICLTGVHAGLDNVLSIMKSAQACLQESLASGKEIGICDELKSIYLCEFFWRQFSPFLKLGVPALIDAVSGTTKGGGEYLAVNQAFDNAAKSAQYITDYYGVNAWNAFKAKSTEQVGSDVCKAFVSLSYPNQANLFEELSKPESPPQISAWITETPLQSITTPPVSQYKIYWHIYAGRDQSIYYVVTMKQPPSPSYYNIPEKQYISSGFIGKGESADVTKDMQAASGYKELCVQISGVGIVQQEKCGFGQATTNFLTQELSDNYAKDQISQQVGNEQECISGTASLVPLIPFLNPNLQAGLQEGLNPEIYKRGINRVCSSNNPGQGVDTGRWTRVGYCNPAKTVFCWLDQDSVNQAIKDLNLKNMSIAAAEDITKNLTDDINWDDARCSVELKNLALPDFKNSIKIGNSSDLDTAQKLVKGMESNLYNLITKCVNDRWKAKAQFEIGALHNDLVNKLKVLSAPLSQEQQKPGETGGVTCNVYWADSKGNKLTKMEATTGQTVRLVFQGNCEQQGYTYVNFFTPGKIIALDSESFTHSAETAYYQYTVDKAGNYNINLVALKKPSIPSATLIVKLSAPVAPAVPCKIIEAKWMKTSAKVGENVTINVLGDKNCGGKNLSIQVMANPSGNTAIPQRLFTSDDYLMTQLKIVQLTQKTGTNFFVQSSWTATGNKTTDSSFWGNRNNYYFNVYVIEDANNMKQSDNWLAIS